MLTKKSLSKRRGENKTSRKEKKMDGRKGREKAKKNKREIVNKRI